MESGSCKSRHSRLPMSDLATFQRMTLSIMQKVLTNPRPNLKIIRQNQKDWWQSGVVKAKNQGQTRLEAKQVDLQRCKGISSDQRGYSKNGAAKERCGERLSTVGSILRDCQGCGENQGGTSIVFKCQCGKMVCIATRMPLTVTQACKVPALVPFYSAGPSSHVVSDKRVCFTVSLTGWTAATRTDVTSAE